MEKILLGKTGIEASRLGLGTVKFGRNEGVKYPEKFDLPDDYTVTRLLSTARECGINLLDTAAAYGTSEERIGQLLKDRADWVIISKAGEEFEKGRSRYNFSPAHCTTSLERSLKRLRTDYLDILLIHSDGSDLQILSDEKLIRKLEDFKKSGMVRAVGASTKTIEGGIKALELLDIAMVEYSPSYTEDEAVLDYAAKTSKPVLLKKILNSGHLKENQNIQSIMNFAFSHPGASAAIIGTIKPERLRQNAAAAQLALKPQARASAAESPGSS